MLNYAHNHMLSLTCMDSLDVTRTLDGAGRGNRTPTLSLELDFESSASTNSAIPAEEGRIIHESPLLFNSYFAPCLITVLIVTFTSLLPGLSG